MSFKTPAFVPKKPAKVVEEQPEVVEELEDLEEEMVDESDDDLEEMEDLEEMAVSQEEQKPKTKKEKKVSDPDKPKQKRNEKLIDEDAIKFVRQNVKEMPYTDMAEHLGLTTNQVNRILQTIKAGLRQYAIDQDNKAYAFKKNKKGEDIYNWTEPLSDIAKKVEMKIESELSRPAESRVGAGGDGKVQKALNSEIDDLLAGL
jgi:hypothetical protein